MLEKKGVVLEGRVIEEGKGGVGGIREEEGVKGSGGRV